MADVSRRGELILDEVRPAQRRAEGGRGALLVATLSHRGARM